MWYPCSGGHVSGKTLFYERQDLCHSNQQFLSYGTGIPFMTTMTTGATKLPFRCQHYVITLECEECGDAMTPEQRTDFRERYMRYYLRYLEARRARCQAATKELKVQETPNHSSSRKIRFQLDDL